MTPDKPSISDEHMKDIYESGLADAIEIRWLIEEVRRLKEEEKKLTFLRKMRESTVNMHNKIDAELRQRDEAIKNFHKIYYSIEDITNHNDLMMLHHAVEHLFDAAEIKSTVCPPGRNDEIISMAKENKDPPKDCIGAWTRATNPDNTPPDSIPKQHAEMMQKYIDWDSEDH